MKAAVCDGGSMYEVNLLLRREHLSLRDFVQPVTVVRLLQMYVSSDAIARVSSSIRGQSQFALSISTSEWVMLVFN